nr:MAG TPA: outer membrane protein assembly factor [Caudoviricetes sp.]
MRKIKAIFIAVLILSLSGCKEVHVYDDNNIEDRCTRKSFMVYPLNQQIKQRIVWYRACLSEHEK